MNPHDSLVLHNWVALLCFSSHRKKLIDLKVLKNVSGSNEESCRSNIVNRFVDEIGFGHIELNRE